MDFLTIVGVLLAVGAILGGNMLEGGHIGSLLQLTAGVIVLGGTVGAIMVQTPLPVFVRSLIMVIQLKLIIHHLYLLYRLKKTRHNSYLKRM